MFKKIFGKIEHAEITLREWILGFFCIVFVRILLENFSNVSLSGFVTSDAPTIIHYFLFFVGVVLSLLLVWRIFIPDHRSGEKFALFGAIVMWLPPIFDLIVSAGKGYRLAYPSVYSLGALFRDVFAFWGMARINGATPGIYLEILLITGGVFLYAIFATKSAIRSVAAAVFSYLTIFAWSMTPSILTIIGNFFAGNGAYQTVAQFFTNSAAPSLISGNFLHPTIILSPLRSFEIFFDVVLAQVYYIIIFFLFAAYIFATRRQKFFAVVGNSRPLRLFYYYVSFVLGGVLALRLTHSAVSFNWLDVIYFIVIAVAYYCAWLFAVGTNDIADVEIDKISNPMRPLASGGLAEADMKNANFFFLAFALIGGFLSGHYVLFMMIAALAISYVYSAPPLEFRRIPLFGNFLMSLAYLTFFLSGFFVFGADKSIHAFPLEYAILVIAAITIGTTVKDIKDADGDRAVGIMTLPALFGEKNGKRIVGAMLALAFLLAPLILGISRLVIPSLIAGVLAYTVINHKPYREWQIFVLYFLYAATVIVLF